jgi:hypothetical protein
MNENDELLKILKEFNITIDNYKEIDFEIYKNYNELLMHFLCGYDIEFSQKLIYDKFKHLEIFNKAEYVKYLLCSSKKYTSNFSRLIDYFTKNPQNQTYNNIRECYSKCIKINTNTYYRITKTIKAFPIYSFNGGCLVVIVI